MSEEKIKLTRHVERKPTDTDRRRPLDTMVAASRLIRAAGRREEVFPGMTTSMMVNFIADNEPL
jgi:ribosomal protein S15P/S13E